jgi:S1-C subfamily serine protease
MSVRVFGISSLCIVVILGVSCGSPASQISDAISSGDLDAAERILRDEGALSLEETGLDPELIEARRAFEVSIVSDTRVKVAEYRESGSLELARNSSERASLRCPWSSELHRLVDECRADVSLFEDLAVRWSGKAPLVKASLITSREFLSEASRVRGAVLRDYSLRDIAIQACLNDAEALAPSPQRSALGSSRSALQDFLDTSEFHRWIPSREASELSDFLEQVMAAMSSTSLGDCVDLLEYPRPSVPDGRWFTIPHSRLVSHAQAHFASWFNGFIRDHLDEIRQNSEFVDAAIVSFSSDRGWVGPAPLGLMCAARAEHLRASDSLSLGAIYMQLASEVNVAHIGYRDAYRDFVDELRSLGFVEYTFSVDFGTSIDPELMSIVVPIVWAAASAAGDSNYWKSASDPDEAKVRIIVSEAELVTPDLAGLSTVSSSFYSHQETRRNPDLDYLESRVNSTRSSMNFSKSMYSSAVTTHNINPTQWSMNAANSAYTNYSISVNTFNAAVRAYNRAPATVQRPVYLAYQFSEGTIEYGWRFVAEIAVNGNVQEFESSQLRSQFVRLGTNRLDRDESRRSDREMPNFSADVIIGLLTSATQDCLQRVALQMEEDLLQFSHEGMTSGEVDSLRALLMPLSSARTERAPRETLLGRSAIQVREAVGAVEEVRRIDLATSSSSLLSSQPREFTCQIDSGYSQGAWTSSQSGALISSDGYVLSCAHGLVGERHQVTLPVSGAKVPARLIRIDRAVDVALLKVEPVSNGHPFAMVLHDTDLKPGIPVHASGFPTTPSGVSGFALSLGSLLGLAQEDPTQMILDLTVSSGSSGGPILNDLGEVIGVTLAVGSPSLGEATGVASSGYVAVARGIRAALHALRINVE